MNIQQINDITTRDILTYIRIVESAIDDTFDTCVIYSRYINNITIVYNDISIDISIDNDTDYVDVVKTLNEFFEYVGLKNLFE